MNGDYIATFKNIALNIFNEEKKALNNLIENFNYDNFYDAIKLIKDANKLIISGIGKSGIVAQKFSSCLNSIGVTSVYLNPQEALHGDIGIVQENDVIIMISKSGTTKELLNIIPLIKERKNKIISILCTNNSTIGQMSDISLICNLEREACNLNLVPTSSIIVSLAICDAIVDSLIYLNEFKPDHFLFNHPHGQLGKNLKLTINDLMYKNEEIPFIYAHYTIKELLVIISKKKLGCTIVLDSNNNYIGLITDGDIRRFWQSTNQTKIDIGVTIESTNSIINLNSITYDNENDKIYNVIDLINKHNIKILPIVKNKKCIGLLDINKIIQ